MPSTNIWIMCVVMIILSPISWFILDEYGIRYYLMRKILKKRWWYSAVTYSLLLSNLLLLITAWFFPNWWLYILGGIWIGTIGQFPPLNHGVRSIYLISYKGSYEITSPSSLLALTPFCSSAFMAQGSFRLEILPVTKLR